MTAQTSQKHHQEQDCLSLNLYGSEKASLTKSTKSEIIKKADFLNGLFCRFMANQDLSYHNRYLKTYNLTLTYFSR